MYSKAFERPYGFIDKTGIKNDWKARKPVILSRLSELNDALENAQGINVENHLKTAELHGLTLKSYHSFAAIKKTWQDFEKHAACFVYQQFSFCRTWYESVGEREGKRLHMVVIRDRTGEVLMLVPLCISKGRFGTVVTMVGDGMADYLCPLVQDDFAASLSETGFATLWRAILATIDQKIDLVWLDRQPVKIISVRNPLTLLDHFPFSSSSHALDFPAAENWLKCARIVRSNKSAKKIEGRIRKLSRLGELTLLEMTSNEDRQRHISELLALKIDNLDQANILHRMDKPEVARFYSSLVADPAMQENICQFELRCGKELLASVLGFVRHDTFYYQVCAFNRKEFGQYSPGLLLLYQLFDWSFSHGLKRFDMTIGDENYKEDWANDTTAMVTVASARTLAGQLELSLRRLLLWSKTRIKNTEGLRKMVMKLLKK